jgi:hypothetical protein
MKGKFIAVFVVISIIVAFGIFVALAQAQIIFVSYFTPTYIEFERLQKEYPLNGSMNFSVSLKGFGSNCIAFKMEMLRKESSAAGSEEQVAYHNKIDDCRKIQISQRPYNYSQDFSYSGPVVLGKTGEYKVQVNVFDEITKQNSTSIQRFMVVK